MVFVKLALIFLVIILLLTLKRSLWQALLGGLAVTALFYRIPPLQMARLAGNVVTVWSSLQVLLSLYLITFLQRILEARSQIRLAQEDLNGLFHNRRVNVIGACLFIGLLPSAASMLLCAELVRNATDGYLEPREQALVSSWFRHIPESCLPTYTSVLLMLSLSGVETGKFIAGMIVPVFILGALGYFTYLRRIPTAVDTPKSTNRWQTWPPAWPLVVADPDFGADPRVPFPSGHRGACLHCAVFFHLPRYNRGVQNLCLFGL